MADARVDLAIVGGGLVGAAIAFGLRESGLAIAILDEGDRAYRASRGNFGLVWVQGKGAGLPAYGNWTQASAHLWPKLASDLAQATGIDVALAQPGGVHLCLSRRELDHRAAMIEALLAQRGFERYRIDMLDRDALARRLPGLGPDVVGGSWSGLDGHCNPLRLLDALHAACARAGIGYRPGAAVRAITPHRGAFALDTAAGLVHAGRVVLAAGLGNARLAPMVGLRAPVAPNQGQILALERVRPFLPVPVETLRQTDDGTVLVGDAQRDTGFDESLSTDVLAAMASRAVRMFPALAGVRVTRAWAALRVMSPDGFPIYAASRTAPGAYVATCHSGVTLAAVHAYRLAPAILAGALPADFDVYSPDRFDARAAA
ncbi:MAG: FAD-dependent oxidoreductase [Betaproteobacteria bacterium]